MRTTHCTLHTPGHSVHYLQNRQVLGFARHYPGRLVDVHLTDIGAGWFDLRIGEYNRLGWYHDHDLVTDIARDSVLGDVQYIPDFHALVRWVGEGAGTVLFPSWGEARRCVEVTNV